MYFSIIIPTFNSAGTFSRVIESVLNQDFDDFELLIIDGLSDDSTCSIASGYGDDRIKIYSDVDKGIYDAMNKGLTLAKGNWIYYLGSDDVLHDRRVLSDVRNMIASSLVDVIYGNVLLNGDTQWAKDKEVYGGKFTLDMLLKKNICHQGIFYRLDFLRIHKLKFDLKYPISADWDLNLKCWLLSDFVYLNRVVAVFSAGGLSSDKAAFDPFWEDRKIIYRAHYNRNGNPVKILIGILYRSFRRLFF